MLEFFKTNFPIAVLVCEFNESSQIIFFEIDPHHSEHAFQLQQAENTIAVRVKLFKQLLQIRVALVIQRLLQQ